MTKKAVQPIKTESAGVGDARLTLLFTVVEKELSVIHRRLKPSPMCKAVERQMERCRKKALFARDADSLDLEARTNFLRVNKQAEEIRVNIPSLYLEHARIFIRDALEDFTLKLTGNHQEVLDFDLLAGLWRDGPGASNEHQVTHPAMKLLESWPSITTGALTFVRAMRTRCSLFARILGDTENFLLVRGNKLSTVAKNETTRRTTCKEALENMRGQLAAGAYIEGALKMVGVDISTQADKNNLLAMIGSLNGSCSTIDLKNASDLITPCLIKALWPNIWYYLFMSLRSEECEVTNKCWVKLNMMSTMGNGFTFPMMTLTLRALVHAAAKVHGVKGNTLIGVFGDDIIVPTEIYPAVCCLLGDAGLVVNTDKSYAFGPFRESCGGDYWMGYNVTPFYIKSLRSEAEVYSAINQVTNWCARHNLLLTDTLNYLGTLLDETPLFVPAYMDPSSGILTSQVKKRFRHLKPVPLYRQINMHHRRENVTDEVRENLYAMEMALILGGFVEPTNRNSCYRITVRRTSCDVTPYCVAEARLPRGFLDGRADDVIGHEDLSWIDSLLDGTTLYKR